MAEAKYLDVDIMGREYRVTCTPDEREALLQAVTLVDAKMREISGKSKNATAERIAVMAAINIAHETLGGKAAANSFDFAGAKRSIEFMEAQLDAAMSKD